MSDIPSDVIIDGLEVLNTTSSDDMLKYIIIILLGVLVICSMMNYRK